MATRLCELTGAMVKVNQPLKWDVFSAKGELLLHKGFIVLNETQLENLLDRGMYADASEVEKTRSKAVLRNTTPSWNGIYSRKKQAA